MIVRAAEPGEYAEICDMVDSAFNQSKIERTIIKVTTGEDLNFLKGDLRVAEVDGKIVAMMMITRRPLRIGTAIVDGAIVGPVATHPDHQKKGYCSSVMRNAVQYMKNQGFDLTLLWGIPSLYPRYGYSPSMVTTQIIIKPVVSGSTENTSHEIRSFVEADLGQMTQIYHTNTATKTCAEIRSEKMWEWKPGGPEVKLNILAKKGEVIGYCALGKDWYGHPCAHEIGVSNTEACEAIFSDLLKTVKKKGVKEFHCNLHPDHPFSRFAFRNGCDIRIHSSEAGMARVLNLVSLLTKMKNEFERRVYFSEFHDVECTLKVSSEEEFIFLNIDHGRISVGTDRRKCDYQFDLPLAYLNPLVTGFKDIRELVASPHASVRGGKRGLRLIEVLFPRGFPFGAYLPLFWE